MDRVKILDTAIANAKALVASGNVDRSTTFSFSGDDFASILNDGDWDAVKRAFLGFKVGADATSSETYVYPVIKNGMLSRHGLVLAKFNSLRDGYSNVADAAESLLKAVDEGLSQEDLERIFMDDLHSANMAVIGSIEIARDAVVRQPFGTVSAVPERATWAQFVREGRNPIDDSRGHFDVDTFTLETLAAEYNGRSNIMAIDYNHNTVSWFGDGDKAAAGWVQSLVAVTSETDLDEIPVDLRKYVQEYGFGLYGLVTWTPRGWESIQSNEYRYLSPVLEFDDAGRPVRVYNGAATNTPALTFLKPLAASKQPALNVSEPTGTEPEIVNNENQEEDIMLEKLMELLGVTTDVEVFAKVVEIRDANVTLAEQVKDLTAKHSELSDKFAAIEAEKAVETAISEGKLLEVQRAWATEFAKSNPAEFTKFLEVTPAGSLKENGEPPKGMLTVNADEKPMEGPVKLGLSGYRVVNNDPEKIAKVLSEAK